jgi:hypothetical protein
MEALNSVVPERDFRNLPVDPPIQADPNWLPLEISVESRASHIYSSDMAWREMFWLWPAENSLSAKNQLKRFSSCSI